jgi:pantoate--beta-alanine ligase
MTQLLTTIAQVREHLAPARRQSSKIGCVPTMGALHSGHGALIERARADADIVVVTIFVNPIQFDRKEDYDRYAKNLDSDLRFCGIRGVDLVFAPSVVEMYPEPLATFVETPELARYLCGASRPGHFRGVATVVAKLFNIVQPDLAYFGEKDAQQLAIIRQMTRDLNFPIRIIAVPTVREPDGLALSSRNQRLTQEERRIAPLIYQALMDCRRMIESGERQASKVKREVLHRLENQPGFRVDYVDVVDAERMQPVDSITGDVRIAAAVWVGNTRLIDNVLSRIRDSSNTL